MLSTEGKKTTRTRRSTKTQTHKHLIVTSKETTLCLVHRGRSHITLHYSPSQHYSPSSLSQHCSARTHPHSLCIFITLLTLSLSLSLHFHNTAHPLPPPHPPHLSPSASLITTYCLHQHFSLFCRRRLSSSFLCLCQQFRSFNYLLSFV